MEEINEAHVRGTVRDLTTARNGGLRSATLSVSTSRMLTDREGNAYTEVTWHTITAFEGGSVNLEGVTEGATVDVRGRMRNVRYVKPDGTETLVTEIAADELRAI